MRLNVGALIHIQLLLSPNVSNICDSLAKHTRFASLLSSCDTGSLTQPASTFCTTAMSPYIPLPKGCVRLLRLLPPSGDESRIKGQLITCSLLDSRRTHSYEALSYVWGLEKCRESIWIDDNELSVGANLYKALSHLRDCFVERILWVDAICINQDDDKEKGHQVGSMAKIYAKASRVIVWLGEAADDSNHALKAILSAAEEQDTDYSIHKTHQQASFAPPDRQATESGTNETDQQAVLALLGREWFQRIWVRSRQSTI
jgi:hypothetical protein